MTPLKHELFPSFQVVNLDRSGVVNLSRYQVVSLNRSGVVNFTGFCTVGQKDYKSLAEKLQSNIDLLTSNCTMKGKAHDELHKWLLPYIDLVKELSEAKDETEEAKHFENIQTSFTTFNQYFQ